MRLSLLLVAAVALAACQNTPTEAVADEAPSAPEAPAAPDAPEAPAEPMPSPEEMAEMADTPVTLVSDTMPGAPERIATGTFTGASGHDVAGTAILYRLDDGTHLVRLEGLESDNGPDLEVWLVRRTSGNVGRGGVDLGDLKSTRGDQNYAVPAGVDVSEFVGVSVWCDRFNVNFGTAPLAQ